MYVHKCVDFLSPPVVVVVASEVSVVVDDDDDDDSVVIVTVVVWPADAVLVLPLKRCTGFAKSLYGM